MQLISTFFDALPADLPAGMAVVLGLAALAVMLHAKVRKSRGVPVQQPAALPEPTPAEKPQSRTDVALQELSRVPDLQSMQARAAEQIDAAEHALNRLLAECAGIADLPVEPTLTPERQLKPEAAVPARQSLAA